MARYYDISFTQGEGLSWLEDQGKKETAESLDGSYILRTDRKDLSAEETWLMYSLLTVALPTVLRIRRATDESDPLNHRYAATSFQRCGTWVSGAIAGARGAFSGSLHQLEVDPGRAVFVLERFLSYEHCTYRPP